MLFEEKSMNTIKYNGKDYPVRTFTMFSEETGEVTYTIADEELFDLISVDDKYLSWGTPEHTVDEQIYFYVERGQLDLPSEEICKDCLDIEFTFIEEE